MEDEKRLKTNELAREKYKINREIILSRRKKQRIQCDYCPFTVCSAYYLKEHMQRRHQNVEKN